jgi:hypothetical protein
MVIYMETTRPRDGIGRWGFWALIVVLLGSYVSTLFAPPPTDMKAIAVFGIVFGWLFVLSGWWVDRHRELREVV